MADFWKTYWAGLKTRVNSLAEDAAQTEISAIPGPIAELVVLYLRRDWIEEHKIALKAIRRPASLFLNILFPNEGLGRFMTQLNSDFWVSFEKTWEEKLKDPSYLQDKDLDTNKWGDRVKTLVATIKEKGGKFGQWVAEQYEGGKLEKWIEKFKSQVEGETLQEKLDDIKTRQEDLGTMILSDDALATKQAEYEKFLEDRKKRREGKK